MRRILALLFLVVILVAAPAIAQTQIHRCMGADGNLVFTDQLCEALNATPLARTLPPPGASAELSRPAVLCAADMAALKQAVMDAFVNRDANRLAGLMLWGGYGHGMAVADIRSLQRMMREPLLDFGPPEEPVAGHLATDDSYTREFHPFDASASASVPATPPPTAPAPDKTFVLRTGASGDGAQLHEMRFTVVRRSGCLWLRSAD